MNEMVTRHARDNSIGANVSTLFRSQLRFTNFVLYCSCWMTRQPKSVCLDFRLRLCLGWSVGHWPNTLGNKTYPGYLDDNIYLGGGGVSYSETPYPMVNIFQNLHPHPLRSTVSSIPLLGIKNFQHPHRLACPCYLSTHVLVTWHCKAFSLSTLDFFRPQKTISQFFVVYRLRNATSYISK